MIQRVRRCKHPSWQDISQEHKRAVRNRLLRVRQPCIAQIEQGAACVRDANVLGLRALQCRRPEEQTAFASAGEPESANAAKDDA